jgi:hypothetical protein
MTTAIVAEAAVMTISQTPQQLRGIIHCEGLTAKTDSLFLSPRHPINLLWTVLSAASSQRIFLSRQNDQWLH